jgi:hypothetical protein
LARAELLLERRTVTLRQSDFAVAHLIACRDPSRRPEAAEALTELVRRRPDAY